MTMAEQIRFDELEARVATLTKRLDALDGSGPAPSLPVVIVEQEDETQFRPGIEAARQKRSYTRRTTRATA